MGFLEVRRKKKSPNTTHALNGIIRELEKLQSCGTDPNESLEQSIMRGWSGVFEYHGSNGNGKPKLIIRDASTGEVIQPRKASELFDR